jgi:hypothetical protein
MHYLVNWWRQHWKRWNLSKRLKLAEEINYTWSILRSVCCLIKINLILKWPNNIAQNLANGCIREKNIFSKWHLIQTLYATIHTYKWYHTRINLNLHTVIRMEGQRTYTGYRVLLHLNICTITINRIKIQYICKS